MKKLIQGIAFVIVTIVFSGCSTWSTVKKVHNVTEATGGALIKNGWIKKKTADTLKTTNKVVKKVGGTAEDIYKSVGKNQDVSTSNTVEP